MSSPFPGMDPYLEDRSLWSGFHTRLIVAIGARLTRLLPKGYYADLEQHVWLEDQTNNEREPFGYPDNFVAEMNRQASASATTATATLPNLEVTLPKPEKRVGHRFLKIVDQAGNRVVTVLEVLSPSNKKRGEGYEAYLQKRDEVILAGANLVELDLLRGGERLPMGHPTPPPSDFYCVVCRASRFPSASIWTVSLRESLPCLPIPLKPDDDDVVLDLRSCFDRAYEDGGYETRINYSAPPSLPIRPSDAHWAEALLRPKTP